MAKTLNLNWRCLPYPFHCRKLVFTLARQLRPKSKDNFSLSQRHHSIWAWVCRISCDFCWVWQGGRCFTFWNDIPFCYILLAWSLASFILCHQSACEHCVHCLERNTFVSSLVNLPWNCLISLWYWRWHWSNQWVIFPGQHPSQDSISVYAIYC